MDHYMEPLSSQTIVDEDSQDAVVNTNVAELESSQYDEPHTATTPVKTNNDNIPQPPAPKRPRKNPTSTGTRGGKQPASSKLKFTTDDVVEEEDEQPSSLGKNT